MIGLKILKEIGFVVGGGRSRLGATELHDAGKQIFYSMRQDDRVHWN